MNKNTIVGIEKGVPKDTLNVNNIFYTIQGEGPLSGSPCVFLRLAGCNLHCAWCDTEYTHSETRFHDEIINEILGLFSRFISSKFKNIERLVVITGGEPFIQTGLCTLVMELIVDHGCRVQIETSGNAMAAASYWSHTIMEISQYVSQNKSDINLSNSFMIVCSPKTRVVNENLIPHINHYKYVIRHNMLDERDGLPNTNPLNDKPMKLFRPSSTFPRNRIWVSPCDEKDELKNFLNLEAAKNAVFKFGYRLSLQTHKIIKVE